MIKFILSYCLGGLCLIVMPFVAWAEQIEVLDDAAYKRVLKMTDISGHDIETYGRIFEALKKEDFDKADKLSEKLDNPLLMGHVLAEKYLSKGYNSSSSELQLWLEKYGDHPQAQRIYFLARRKGLFSDVKQQEIFVRKSPYEAYKNLGRANYKFIVQSFQNFRLALNKGKTLRARQVLENKNFKKLAKPDDYDNLSAQLAMKYFLDGENQLAYRFASAAAKSGKNGTASWVAGLAAWRLGKYDNAAFYFRKPGENDNKDEWLVSAGYYWSYRAYKKLKMNVKAQQQLEKAARLRRTFYGMLAEYQLSGRLRCNWTALSYLNDFNNNEYLDEALQSVSMRRALILIKIGALELAELEIRHDYKNLTNKQKEVGLYIADQFKMHALAIMISNNLKDTSKDMLYDPVAYPVPKWKPQSGWKEDKALLLALTRQESSFSPKAKSSAGARGLMQLLPSTAAHITKDMSLKKNHQPLLDASYNLELGQQYVSYLLDKPFIKGNLFYMMTAYNAGPGNLYKWLKKVNDGGDPLLFIEAVPARETRIYLERVMANYWMYNSRFGQDNYTLEALARGKFPVLERE